MTYPTLACPACGQPLPARRTHRGKPYWVCDDCGVQIFVRRQAGIERIRRPRQTAQEAWPWTDAGG